MLVTHVTQVTQVTQVTHVTHVTHVTNIIVYFDTRSIIPRNERKEEEHGMSMGWNVDGMYVEDTLYFY